MTDQEKRLILNICTRSQADDEDLERLTQQLREELLELDTGTVDLIKKGKVPETAKAGDLIIWGQLLLTIGASGGVLVALINTLQSWIKRQGVNVEMDINGNKIKLTSDKSSREQALRLIDTYIDVVSRKSDR